MAQIYTVKCPKCGKTFEVTKGILISECDKPVPEERKENTPATCPFCKAKTDLQDESNCQHILSVMFID